MELINFVMLQTTSNQFITGRMSTILAVSILVSVSAVASPEEPTALFLTWQQDPTSTMTIDWHTMPGDQAVPMVRYKKKKSSDWKFAPASQHPFPHSERRIHRTELIGLQPGTYYRFRVGEFEREYKFRTMPTDLSDPVRFVTGGDTDYQQHQMSAVAMQYDPDFILWGGDLSYANGVVYIGDGCWGVSPYDREIGRDEWYISEFAAERNGIVVTLHGAHQHFLMVGEHGKILDEYPETP